MLIGENLKNLRLEKGLSQRQMSKILNIRQGNITQWELNQKFPNVENLVMLADFFQCSTDYILGREEEDGQLTIKTNMMAPEKKTEIQRIFDELPVFYQNRVLGYAQGILEAIGA